MTDLILTLFMIGVPASVLMFIRHLNLRDDRDAVVSGNHCPKDCPSDSYYSQAAKPPTAASS